MRGGIDKWGPYDEVVATELSVSGRSRTAVTVVWRKALATITVTHVPIDQLTEELETGFEIRIVQPSVPLDRTLRIVSDPDPTELERLKDYVRELETKPATDRPQFE